MIRWVIFDDEQPAINSIKKNIDRLPILQLTGSETNPLVGIEIIKSENPDVVFLNIQMNEMNGIEVMKNIGDSTNVVFCAAYSEFAINNAIGIFQLLPNQSLNFTGIYVSASNLSLDFMVIAVTLSELIPNFKNSGFHSSIHHYLSMSIIFLGYSLTF